MDHVKITLSQEQARVLMGRRLPKPAKFTDSQNASKSKALLLLWHRKYQLGISNGLTLREVFLGTGAHHSYLKSRSHLWVRWGYIKKDNEDRFSIDRKGKKFVEDVLNFYNPEMLQRYVLQMKSFRDFIARLDPPADTYKSCLALEKAIKEALAQEPKS